MKSNHSAEFFALNNYFPYIYILVKKHQICGKTCLQFTSVRKTHNSGRCPAHHFDAAVGLSKYHLTRKFKTATGITPVEYLTIIRCQNAQRLLMKNIYTVSEVAELCGFESPSYFSKIFKKTIGLCPSAVFDSFKQS